MNWGKNIWMKERFTLRSPTIKEAFSNITQTFHEFPSTGPYSVKLNSLAEANNVSLNLYRMACRQVPALLNRPGTHYYKDYHMSKRNLGHWFRRGKNMRDLNEISSLQCHSMDVIVDAIYGNTEHSIATKYLHNAPLDREATSNDYLKYQGLNSFDDNRFENKTKFYQKFVKGKRNLY